MPQSTNQTPKRKLALAFFIFLLPAAAILFVVLNFHKKPVHSAASTGKTGAFNTQLPSPNLPKIHPDKLQLYLQAEQDSLKHQQQLDKDPYARTLYAQNNDTLSLLNRPTTPPGDRPGAVSAAVPLDQNILRANQSMQRLYAAMSHYSTDTVRTSVIPRSGNDFSQPIPRNPDHSRNDSLVNAIRNLDTGTDPKLRQINSVLEKVLDIQHPERVVQRRQGQTPKEPSYPITSADPTSIPTRSDSVAGDPYNTNGFYGLSDETESQIREQPTICAVIHETQTLVSGSIVKLRLLQDIWIAGTRIPANTFLFGECGLNGERLDIRLSNVVYSNHLYPISLHVYDGVDGLPGLFIPGAITRDVLKEGSSQGVSAMELGTTLDQNIGAQALQAGVETAKTLLNRKIRLVQITVKAGHTVILKDLNQH